MGNAARHTGKKFILIALLFGTVILFGFIYVFWGSKLFEDIPKTELGNSAAAIIDASQENLSPRISHLQPAETENNTLRIPTDSAATQPDNKESEPSVSQPIPSQNQPSADQQSETETATEKPTSPGLVSRIRNKLDGLL